MKRNIVLAVSSLAVLAVLFVIYTALVGRPPSIRADRPTVEALAPQAPPTTQPLRVGEAVEVPAGGKIMFRRYDDRTGRPRDMFLCHDWQPVADSKNEIRVSGPELATLLPSGMIATISADEGQITIDRVEQSQMKPKKGWLAGHVRLVVDRATGLDRAPTAERPEDLITISLERLEFDLELGELKTDDRISVHSDDFELAGTGLHLIWNQADNRVETLTIARGEELVLYAAAGLFGMATKDQPGPADEAATTTAAAPVPPKERSRKGRTRSPTAYTCVLDGGLVAEQLRGTERLGGLQADQVELLFDVGGTADRFLRADKARNAATSRPAREDRDRLVLHWNGGLRMGPATAGPPDQPSRRRFVAVGRPVVLTRGDAVVRCGRVAFHDDTQRIWLYPTEGGTVEFGMGEKLSATAESIYIDRAARVVKLIGDVELRSRRGTGPTARPTSVRCAYWGELHVAPGDSAAQAPDALLTADRLESACFVGDVQVDLGGQKLTTHRLDVGFHPRTGEQSLEQLLDTALASGDVRLTSGDGSLACAELKLVFDTTPAGELYPWQMDAAGAVVIARKEASVGGNRVRADLAPPPDTAEARKSLFVIRTLHVLGQAEMIDPGNKVAARGHEIAAVFEGMNQLATATVSGTAGELGVVHARPYTVRGGRIDLDRHAQTVHVDGPSRLALKTQRSLEGEERDKPTPVVVDCSKTLHIDGRGNTVQFVGNVVARSAEEQLQGDSMTLTLEDVDLPPAAPAVDTPLRSLWRQARRLAGKQDQSPTSDDLFALRVEAPGERLRKEPLRLVAENALVTSETYEAQDNEPVVHSSISAPLLEVDIVHRTIVTTGTTDVLLTDRRGVRDVEPAREVTGVPAALISRGPSQTAMRCAGRMTYTLGAQGATRRDTVVFEDRVVFVHRTGREMVNLEQMLPQVAEKPELMDELPSQNASLDCDRLECWFTVDAADKATRRGGALTRVPMRLASLMATGNAYLRDQQGPRIREVNAAWIEFDREQGRVHVRGAEQADARVYLEDTKTGQFDVHAGQQLVINLQDGTIRSDRIVGEMRRP
jgi:hypothetical protein